MSSPDVLLRVTGLEKSYAAPVLQSVDFEIAVGEVRALVGANGAGKSTFAKILGGLVMADAGYFEIGGEPYRPSSKRDAGAAGVHVVHQELSLIPTLTVAENLFFGRLPNHWGWIDSAKLDKRARDALEAVGLGDLDPQEPLASLGLGERQLVEIASALSLDCRLLVLDEPTAALTDPQVEVLFEHIRNWRRRGVGLIYISHRLEELEVVADSITVLRDGCVAGGGRVSDFDRGEIVRLMTGSSVRETKRETPDLGGPALRVSGLSAKPAVRDVAFEVRAGEVLGLAGLVGSGRTETLRAIIGADSRQSGEVFRGDDELPATTDNPAQAARVGIGLVPEDRRSQALLASQSVRANLSLSALRLFSTGGWLNLAEEEKATTALASDLGIVMTSLDQPVAELSGGNQQKVALGRAWLAGFEVLLLDEPTRGIDVGARSSIYELIAHRAARGTAFVVASSDLRELVTISDRVAIFRRGRLMETLEGDELDYEHVAAACIEATP